MVERRECRFCTGNGSVRLAHAVAFSAESAYVERIAQAMISRSKSRELRVLEEGYDLYLFLREVYEQAVETPSKRHAILFSQRLIEVIKQSAGELQQSRQQLLEEVQRERQKLMEEEAAAREKARSAREYIQNFGIPDWDYE